MEAGDWKEAQKKVWQWKKARVMFVGGLSQFLLVLKMEDGRPWAKEYLETEKARKQVCSQNFQKECSPAATLILAQRGMCQISKLQN